ncbi:MAG: sugar kinase, partial [Gemmatimonadetes bacterium]|nr:sugar kinase [Gemmatimonadota bacterium]
VVGSVALDTVETPFGKAADALGGSALFFSVAASLFCPVKLVGVVGEDYPLEQLDFLRERGVDLSGLERRPGESFHWAGSYSYDLNTRETLETRLGVFAEFEPDVPEKFRDAEFVFLGNIDPTQQYAVLDQVRAPRLIGCDTMNYWIERTRTELLRTLERVDILFVNDSEARQLAGDYNLTRAARWIQERGPRFVVVKKGEHGAALFARDWVFFAPGYPLEEVFDPTGAGDAFAGGFLGYLSWVGSEEPEELRRAMIYGSVLGSYAVEAFSIDRFRNLDANEVAERAREFRDMTAFEIALQRAPDA